MGLWYGLEIITHHESEAYETVYDSCVVVHLADVNEVSIKASYLPSIIVDTTIATRTNLFNSQSSIDYLLANDATWFEL